MNFSPNPNFSLQPNASANAAVDPSVNSMPMQMQSGVNPNMNLFASMMGSMGNGTSGANAGMGNMGMQGMGGMPNMQQMQNLMGIMGISGMQGMQGMGMLSANSNSPNIPAPNSTQQQQQPQTTTQQNMSMGVAGMNGMGGGMGGMGMEQMSMLFSLMQSNPQLAQQMMMPMLMMQMQMQMAGQQQQQHQAQQQQQQITPSAAAVTAHQTTSALQTALHFHTQNQPPTFEQVIALIYDVAPQVLNGVLEMGASGVGTCEDDDRVLVETIWRAKQKQGEDEVEYGKMLKGLHGVSPYFFV